MIPAALDPAVAPIVATVIGGVVSLVVALLAREAKRSSNDAADAADRAAVDRDACRKELARLWDYVTELGRRNGIKVDPPQREEDEQEGDGGSRRARGRRPKRQ